MTGSALPSSAMRTTASGADSSVPLMIDRARGEELELVASAASYAVAPTTRTGARNGTATQIVTLIPGTAEKRIATTSAEVRMAAVQMMGPGRFEVWGAEVIGFEIDCRVLYTAK